MVNLLYSKWEKARLHQLNRCCRSRSLLIVLERDRSNQPWPFVAMREKRPFELQPLAGCVRVLALLVSSDSLFVSSYLDINVKGSLLQALLTLKVYFEFKSEGIRLTNEKP